MKFRLFVLLLMILFQSCNLFETREPEAPAAENQWNSFPIHPDSTLNNLKLVYNEQKYLVKYEAIFSDDFVFYFDNLDVEEYGVPVSWQSESEINYLNNLYNDSNIKSVELQLSEIDSEPDEEYYDYLEEYYIYREYKLIIDNKSDSLSNEYEGKCVLHLKTNDDHIWKIFEWFDYKEESNWTWGRLKNEYSY